LKGVFDSTFIKFEVVSYILYQTQFMSIRLSFV